MAYYHGIYLKRLSKSTQQLTTTEIRNKQLSPEN